MHSGCTSSRRSWAPRSVRSSTRSCAGSRPSRAKSRSRKARKGRRRDGAHRRHHRHPLEPAGARGRARGCLTGTAPGIEEPGTRGRCGPPRPRRSVSRDNTTGRFVGIPSQRERRGSSPTRTHRAAEFLRRGARGRAARRVVRVSREPRSAHAPPAEVVPRMTCRGETSLARRSVRRSPRARIPHAPRACGG